MDLKLYDDAPSLHPTEPTRYVGVSVRSSSFGFIVIEGKAALDCGVRVTNSLMGCYFVATIVSRAAVAWAFTFRKASRASRTSAFRLRMAAACA